MKRFNLLMIITGLLIISGCKKQINNEKKELAGAGGQTEKSGACMPVMYSLTVDPATGFSYIYKVSGSPGAGPVTVTPYVGGGTNQLIICGGVPLRFATGLAYDPVANEFIGTTGDVGPTPNFIFKFTDPNCVSLTPAVDGCGGLNMDLSDVERDPATGQFFAINRTQMVPNKRIVKITGAVVSCLPAVLPAAMHPRGLTFNCGGQLFVMDVFGLGGTIDFINKVTGVPFVVGPYPGNITPPPAVAFPEMGLHWDCCIGRFITGNYDPIASIPIMTDGLPTAMGGPIYNVMSGVMRLTVDFARP